MSDATELALELEMVAAAAGILGTASGLEALARCEWEPVVDLADADGIRTLTALFRAHGRTLAVTPALGVLGAAALRASTDGAPGAWTAGFEARLDDDRVRFTSLGGHLGDHVVLDVPGLGVVAGPADASADEPAEPVEPTFCRSLAIARSALEPVAGVDAVAVSRRAGALVRLAAANELLGVCDAVLEMATAYAHDRVQYDRPIGTFQAVQHLMADAAIDARSLAAACALAVTDPMAIEPDEGTHLKALAGRSTRRVLQATLQTFGAIGFSWEHDHHRYTRRALTLDAIGGTTEQLLRRIGGRTRGGSASRVAAVF